MLFLLDLCYAHVFGLRLAQFSHYPFVTDVLFWGGLALSFLAASLAATNLPGHWRSGGSVGRFIWCSAVLGGFLGLLAYGP